MAQSTRPVSQVGRMRRGVSGKTHLLEIIHHAGIVASGLAAQGREEGEPTSESVHLGALKISCAFRCDGSEMVALFVKAMQSRIHGYFNIRRNAVLVFAMFACHGLSRKASSFPAHTGQPSPPRDPLVRNVPKSDFPNRNRD
jgi:hypothetical protein